MLRLFAPMTAPLRRHARTSAAAAAVFFLSACVDLPQLLQTGVQTAGQTQQAALTRAVKESLELGSARAADLLSRPGGYLNHAVYRIALPESLQPIAGRVRQFGLGSQVD